MPDQELSDNTLIIEPTVGRMVHYYENYLNGDRYPLAAIVTYVSGNRTVNLSVFDRFGGNMGMSNVRLIQPNDDLPAHGEGPYATWMTYQIGQAAKTEALQEKLNEAESGCGQSLQDGVSD